DIGRAREWTARAVRAERDPAWTADGYVSDRWLPVSPVSGRLDAFQWKVPLAQLGAPGPVIEEARREPAIISPATESGAAAPKTGRRPIARGSRRAATARAEPVIPLVHVPDDPGPHREHEPEPTPEAEPAGWHRLRGLFR